MSTIRQVAREAGVSIATVSRVLNSNPSVSPDVESRVLEVVNRVGYVSAVGRRQTNYIALAYTGPASLGSPYDAALCEGMSLAMAETTFDLVMINLRRDKQPGETYTQLFHRKGIRGVIVRTTTESRNLCVEISREGFPAIVVADRFDEPEVSYVYGDSEPTTRQAVAHLIELGHRRIGFAFNHVDDHDHTDRLRAYRSALAEHDLPFDERLLFRTPASRPDGAQIMRQLMTMPDRPTALFVADPLLAVGAINHAHEMGLAVPEEVSIVGFDDTDVRDNVYPRMTAVCQDAQRIGYEAFMALTQTLLPRQAPVVRKALPTWFEIHDTSGPPMSTPQQVLPNGARLVPAAAPAG